MGSGPPTRLYGTVAPRSLISTLLIKSFASIAFASASLFYAVNIYSVYKEDSGIQVGIRGIPVNVQALGSILGLLGLQLSLSRDHKNGSTLGIFTILALASTFLVAGYLSLSLITISLPWIT